MRREMRLFSSSHWALLDAAGKEKKVEVDYKDGAVQLSSPRSGAVSPPHNRRRRTCHCRSGCA